MTLIKSISGIRGTIGGVVGDNLTPLDIVKFASAYGIWIRSHSDNNKIVIGRDARISGSMVQNLVMNTLVGLGFDVVDIGLSTTPTVEIAVPLENASGGIIITASHNPKQWNALKLLNSKGEFLNSDDGIEILKLAEGTNLIYNDVDSLGKIAEVKNYIDIHIDQVLSLNIIDVNKIKSSNFKIVVDAVNSTGGIAVPKLLNKLGVEVIELYCDPNGHFPHNPEPLKENLTDLSSLVVEHNADLGIVVDPDVDRLAFVCEDGSIFGEEYTLVACADFVLGKTPGSTVSNLSSTRALRDVSQKHGCSHQSSAVGEVNVVEMMKKNNAVIGGEGNGGVIYPESHYGRDSIVGIAMFLNLLAERNLTALELKNEYPSYFMSKQKLQLNNDLNFEAIQEFLMNKYSSEKIDTVDGLKIDFEDSWVQLRKSNTEPIIRIYSEAKSQESADALANSVIKEITNKFM
ncbi:phosphoglucosamine mutase [Flavobacteriaceae bacterium]|nr:phosphoglucosamine mutase [Flavobacteriaceae bacterium]